MTVGFLISFGGLFLLAFLGLAVLLVTKPREPREPSISPHAPTSSEDVAAILADAERSAQRIQIDIARVRAQLAVIEK